MIVFPCCRTPMLICHLALMDDNTFYKESEGSFEDSVREIFFLMSEANMIFRVTDLDDNGVPYNLSFIVQSVVILTFPDEVMPKHFARTENYL